MLHDLADLGSRIIQVLVSDRSENPPHTIPDYTWPETYLVTRLRVYDATRALANTIYN